MPIPSRPTSDTAYRPSRIVSGGQTGVDRAGLDAAIALGIEHGGWCPKGRVAEDGTVPSCYNLREHPSADYPPRTEQNVIDSDATLILYERRFKGGTALTAAICRRLGKPYFVLRLDRDALQDARLWLQKHQPQTLNIAGSRATTSPGIHQRAMESLLRILESPFQAAESERS